MTGLVNFDENLVQDVAARLDLRKPNEDGVRAVARVLAAADGYIERVVDVATGVGKTYLAWCRDHRVRRGPGDAQRPDCHAILSRAVQDDS